MLDLLVPFPLLNFAQEIFQAIGMRRSDLVLLHLLLLNFSFYSTASAIHLVLKMSSSSNSPNDYYANIRTKWVNEYPSTGDIADTFAFYKECGYISPEATLQSMIEPIKTKCSRVLDYGCDKGEMLDFFCRSFDGEVHGYGIDINEEAIKFSKSKYPGLTFGLGDGTTIQYPDKYFDLVIVIAVVKHVRYGDRAKVYAELNRVAKHALLIEADEKDQKVQEHQGWKFYNSNFASEFEQNFLKPIKVLHESGDVLGLYECKK